MIAVEIHAQRYQAQGKRVETSKRYLWQKGRVIKVEGEGRNLRTAKYTRNSVTLLALLSLDALKIKKQKKRQLP